MSYPFSVGFKEAARILRYKEMASFSAFGSSKIPGPSTSYNSFVELVSVNKFTHT
jgi:hypothetical protein